MAFAWVITPIIVLFGIALQALIMLIFNMAGRGKAPFRQLWAAAVNIGIPLIAVNGIVTAIIALVRGSQTFDSAQALQTVMPSLGYFAPTTAVKLHAFLTFINPFTLWGTGLVIAAMAIVAGRLARLGVGDRHCVAGRQRGTRRTSSALKPPHLLRGAAMAVALLIALLARAPDARAATLAPPTMTLPDAVAYALSHSSSVATQRAALTNAQHQLALQRGVAYPLLDASVQSILAKSANYQGSFAVIGAQQQNVVSQNTAQIGVSNWNLTSGGYSFLLVAAARAQEEQAAKTLTNTEDLIATNVTNSYYAIVERRGLVAVDEFTLRYQNELVSQAQIKERAGVAAGVDVLQAKTSAAKSESTLIADRSSVEDASQTLAQQIGAPILTQFALPVHVPQPAIPHGDRRDAGGGR